MGFLELAKERYSVRKYKPQPVEREKLDRILEAAKVAPTGGNRQPFRIYVMQSPEALEKIRGLTKMTFNAPLVMMLTRVDAEMWKSPLDEGISAGEQDCAIVAAHMMMEAWEQGIGSCWVKYFPHALTAEAFALPEGEDPMLLMPMGYPADDAVPRDMHTIYRDMAELVKEL